MDFIWLVIGIIVTVVGAIIDFFDNSGGSGLLMWKKMEVINMVKLSKIDLRKSGDIRLVKIKVDLIKHGSKKVNLKKSVWWVAENCDETGYICRSRIAIILYWER